MANSIIDSENKLFLHTYNRLPIEISHGSGVHLFDTEGNRYLDFFSGLAVNALGYAHPGIVQAVCSQMQKFAHLSNNYITGIQIEFTALLLKYSGMSKAFLTNSGTESVEGTIKLIRKHYGPDKKILSLTGSFHGRTYGAVTLTGKEKYTKGFEPLLPGIDHIIFNDAEDLQKKVGKDTAAVFIEFIQGEGGINVVSEEFARTLSNLRNEFGFAIVSDEIQTGVGRTGRPFACNLYNIDPDVIVAAKAIGGGLPLGAILVSQKFENVFTPGIHGTTFGGSPVCCAAGKVVLREVFENGLMEKVDDLGGYLTEQLEELKHMFPQDIKEIRGKGFMQGIEMNYPCSEIVSLMRQRKVLTNCTNNTVLRLLPPLITTKNDIDFFLFNFHEVLKTK
ncbi:MAG TPA: acetylornithine/succinylornithine family transaminase [Ignavibacteriaceae bacterium]|nr:acetylornithine/succinylornithine family transaminase [Ignavibacteriaceae bacterium]